MRRQRTAIGLSPLALISRLTGRFCPVVSGVLRGERGLDIFQRQLHLVLRRLRSGALGGEMDRIAAHFSEVGYKRASAKMYISHLGRFSDFAARNARTAVIDQT